MFVGHGAQDADDRDKSNYVQYACIIISQLSCSNVSLLTSSGVGMR